MTIKEMRDLTGLTQKDFANKFGIPVGTLRRWEYGESKPAPYVLRLIVAQLPIKKESLTKIESPYGVYYYDKITNFIMDKNGTRIFIEEPMDGVKEQNLSIYAKELFDSYYNAVERFNRDCRFDKQEDILWS